MKKIKFEDLPSENTPINSANLDTLQNNIEESVVVVSPTEPTTKEKVWFQKGKNLFKITLNSKEIDGLNVRVNSDKSITINGTSTDVVSLDIVTTTITQGNYFLSGCPKGGSEQGYSIYIAALPSYGLIARDIGNGISFSRSGNTETITRIRIGKNTTINNLTFKPMLEEGSVGTSYEPHKINKILTKTNGTFEEFYGETEVITNENGTAIKYANGLMKIYRKIENVKLDITTPWGNLFVGTNVNNWDFPVPFISKPFDYSARIEMNDNISTFPVNYATTILTNQRLTNISVGRPTSKAGATGTVYITATGYWK